MISLMVTAAVASMMCPPLAQASAGAAPPVTGGYQHASIGDAGIRAAADFAAASVNGKVSAIHGGERQVVAGTNYRISFTTTDGRRFDATIFQALDRAFNVTAVQETGAH